MDLIAKKHIIGQLNSALFELNDIIFDMQVKGISEGLNKVKKRRSNLSNHIDAMIASAMKDWKEDALVVTAQIKQCTAQLQKIEAKIEQNKKTASNVIKAIGLVDDIIKITTKFL